MISGKKYDLFAVLRERFPETALERDFSFARHTTIGCGGRASVAVCPPDTESLAKLLRFLNGEGIPYCYLGAGANVLPRDGVFEGVVVRFCAMNALLRRNGTVTVDAGVTGGRLLSFAREHALCGLEPFTGIPMSVGGGITMNAGITCRHFSDVVTSVVAVINGEVCTLSVQECAFAEKRSVFQSGIAVAQARILLAPSTRENIVRESAYFRARRAHLPKGRSMGCTFVNPKGKSAGALIEECGLKGASVGKARVSEAHANFIINEGDCARDVATLIERVKRTVFEKTGIALREEIRRLPPSDA